MDTAAKILGLILSLAAVVAVAVKFRAWWRRTAEVRYKKTVGYQLQLLCVGQSDIYVKLGEMDKAREVAKCEDAEMHRHLATELAQTNRRSEELNNVVVAKLDAITADVSLSVVANGVALDGLVQLGKQSNTIVNGLVGQMRAKLNDRIIEGVGAIRPTKKGEPK